MGQVDHCYLVGWVGVIFYYLSLSSLHSFFCHCFEGKILLEEAQIFLSLFSERLVGVLFFWGGVVFISTVHIYLVFYVIL